MDKYIEADTNKMKDSVSKLKKNITEYETKINSFFKKLEFGGPNDAWTGNNAILFSKLAEENKVDYIDFGNGIKEIINELDQFTRDLENQIKENESICESGSDSYGSYY